MAGDPRLLDLLEEMLDSGRTPEEVCRDCPELLPEVRERWRRFGPIDDEIGAMFPEHGADPEPAGFPQVPGYEVEGVLGRGGMGVVYRARHLRLNRPVALKMLLTGPFARPVERERFRREAEAVAALSHPNVVRVYDCGEHDGRPFFTMELMEGGTLSRKLAGTPLPGREAAALVAALADAVGAAHAAGVVHRDLKPSNVLLAADGTPKVSDFGLAWRIEGEAGLTRTGAAVGTPSYMAPEQAEGERGAIGPATDVYALGAVLYECLTGRPPFRAESDLATLYQVAAREPVPPSRLNHTVPRDLETVCLKCLEKDQRRRYPTAAALADDLRRFGRGEPIVARPVGALERAAKWARRRPALAGALAAGVLLASALVVTVVWWHGQRAALESTAVAYAEADLSESERLRDRGEFKASAAVLGRSKDRLREFVPPELRDRLSTAFGYLELVTRLDAIRLERALVKPTNDQLGVLVSPVIEVPRDGRGLRGETPSARHYEEAFRAAGIGALGDDPAEAAAGVRGSPVRGTLVAALDDWAGCAADRDQQAWVLAVVRRADPDLWRDRVRDPATWDNPEALRDLAARAPVVEQSPQLLAVLGARLRVKNLNAVPFLTRVVSAYPADFWVNVETGNALSHQRNSAEAVGYYRAALALRPQTASLHSALGGLYLGMRRWDEAIVEYEQAVRMDPENAWCHNRLGFTLAWKGGRDDEAIARFREALRIDADNGWSHYFLAIALENKGLLDEASGEFREAARLLPEKRTESRQRRRGLLLRLGRGAEARAAWKQELAANPPRHDDWFGYAELCLFQGDEAEYRRARRELLAQFGATTDADVAERTGRTCLLLPAPEGELEQAVALTERAVATSGANPYYLFAQGLARFRQGHFDDAIKLMNGKAASVMGPSPRLVLAMAQYQKGQKDQARKTLAATVTSHDWNTTKATNHDAWITHILRREAEALIGADRPEPGPVP